MNSSGNFPPVILSTLLELEKHVPGASRYLGRVHVNLTSDRFLTITRSTDEWTKSIVSIVDLGTPESPVKVSRFDVFLDTYGLYAEATKCAVDPTGKYCIIYDLENVWISKESTKPFELGEMKKVEMNLGPERIRLVVWNGHESILILTNTRIAALDVRLDGRVNITGHVYALVVVKNPYRCETTADKQWAVCTALPDKVDLEEDASGSLRKIVFLKLDDLELPQLNLTTSAGTIYTKKSCSDAIVARAGEHKFSTLVSFFALDENEGVPSYLRFQEEFQCERDHDMGMTDTPIAIHVVEKHEVIFIVTKLSYIHVCLLKNGKYVGSSRISRFRITASTVRSDKSGIILVDANGTVFQALSQPPSKYPPLPAGVPQKIVEKITALRELIHKETTEPSQEKQSFFKPKKDFYDIFPDFVTTSAEGYRRACEVTEYLTREELLQLYGYFLKSDVSLMSLILMLAKKYLDKTGVDEPLVVVEKYCGAKGVSALLSLVGTPNLDSRLLVKYLEAAITLGQYHAIEHAFFTLKITDPVAAKTVLHKSLDTVPEIAAIYPRFCVKFGFVEDLVKYNLKQRAYPQIKQLIEKQIGSIFRIFRALQEADIADALFEAYVDLLKPANFTQEFLNIFAGDRKMEIVRKQLWKLVAESSDERLVSLLLASYGEEPAHEELMEYLGRLTKQQSERLGNTLEKTHPQLALLVYAKGECSEALFKLVQADTARLEKLSGYLSKSEDVSLWLNVIKNPHMLPKGLTLGKAVLTHLRNQIPQEMGKFDNAEVLLKNDCAVFLAIFPTLKVVFSGFATDLIGKFLAAKTTFENEEKVFRTLEENMLEMLCELPDVETHVFSAYLQNYTHYNPLTVLVTALTTSSRKISNLIIKEIRESYFDPVTRQFSFEVTKDHALSLAHWVTDNADEKEHLIFVGDVYMQVGDVEGAVVVYEKAEHPDNYRNVIAAIKQKGDLRHWDHAAGYYEMASKTVKDPALKIAMSIAYVKANRLDDIENLFPTETQQQPECVICEDAPRAMRFEPCGHLVTCVHCAPKVTACPICRETITRADRTYV
ncbi:hypothetical protein RvY_14350 [Ramazzottius varieornatus]|uniref:RING-type domain-containing protein n=1 Tax=Ramazzottius varieornatus TaxID=947166 RepID=A0A1D1VR17_RAMVA|nr:hypothetical protein RvY_14350 [Ramazzottius varieornatus]